jgi:hypothetical protein
MPSIPRSSFGRQWRVRPSKARVGRNRPLAISNPATPEGSATWGVVRCAHYPLTRVVTALWVASTGVVVADTDVNNGYKGGPLPLGCPPPDSVDVPKGFLLRLVPTNPCTAEHFRSGHAEGKNQPSKCDLCTWMSCSVWSADTPHEVLAGLTLLKNLSHMKFVARFKVAGSEGKIRPHDKDQRHLSFWMRESFAAASAVEEHIPL